DSDPLLYIESIPYAETRGYVTTVLRNYWMYQRQSGEKTASLKALAQGAWPRFPGAQTGPRAGLVTSTPAPNPSPRTPSPAPSGGSVAPGFPARASAPATGFITAVPAPRPAAN